MITNSFAWYQRFIAIHTTSYAWFVFEEKEFSNLHQVWNVVQTRNIIPQDFLILVIRKKSSWGLGRRWKGRGQWVGGDIIAPPRHPPISTHPSLCPQIPILSCPRIPSYAPFQLSLHNLHLQIYIRFWSNPYTFTFFRLFFSVNTFLIHMNIAYESKFKLAV